MQVIFAVCAFLVMCCSSHAQNFFDYSDEKAMLGRFRDFVIRKDSSIRQLAHYGVFKKKVDQENIVQAKSISQMLWLDIAQHSIPFSKLIVEQADCDEVNKQFLNCYRNYQSIQNETKLDEEIVRHLTLFSRLKWIIEIR